MELDEIKVIQTYLYKVTILVVLVFGYTSVGAVDDQRLWLPLKYQKLFLDLKQAAIQAEMLDRCEEVLSGTLDRDQSTVDHPIYKITCRQDSGRSYNEMVDGVSFKTLTTVLKIEVPLTPEQILKKKVKRHKKAEAVCAAQLEEQSRLMNKFKVLDSKMPEISMAEFDEPIQLTVDFDAATLTGDKLEYRSECLFNTETDFKFEIYKR